MSTTTTTTTAAPAAAAPGAAVTPSATPAPITATPTGGVGATPEASGVTPTDWKSGFSPELKGYVDLKGFKDPVAMADAYRNLEKAFGVPQDRLLKLPEAFYDDKGKLTAEGRAIFDRLGAPKEAKDYNLQMPKEGGDPKLMEHFKSVFHDAGIPKAAAEKIVASWNEFQAQNLQTMKDASVQAFKDQQTKLQSEWGSATEQNTNIAKQAMQTMGLTTQQVDAISSSLGHAETMKLLHKLGTATGEAPFVGGSNPNRLLEPQTAQAKIKALMSDAEFGSKLSKGDSEAKRMWESLHAQAYPGTMTIS